MSRAGCTHRELPPHLSCARKGLVGTRAAGVSSSQGVPSAQAALQGGQSCGAAPEVTVAPATCWSVAPGPARVRAAWCQAQMVALSAWLCSMHPEPWAWPGPLGQRPVEMGNQSHGSMGGRCGCPRSAADQGYGPQRRVQAAGRGLHMTHPSLTNPAPTPVPAGLGPRAVPC